MAPGRCQRRLPLGHTLVLEAKRILDENDRDTLQTQEELMPICHDSKTIFFHIPKCGGSSIEELFNLRNEDNLYVEDYDFFSYKGVRFAPQHLTPEVLFYFAPHYRDYTSFTVIRDPLERAVSEFFWLHQDLYRRPQTSFDEYRFQRWIRDETSKKDRDHYLPQVAWARGVDHIILLDDLNGRLPDIAAWFGRPLPLDSGQRGHMKQSDFDTMDIARNLTSKSVELIESQYGEDFELFYSCGGTR